MGTRSRIGIRNADDTVDSIYCHWDGYPEHNGRLLVEHYTDQAKVRELIALGDLSSLGEEIGVKHPFDTHDFPGGYDKYNQLYGKMCTAYGRDRGETAVDAEHSHSVDAFLRIDCGAEYYYIFHYGRWMVRSGSNWVLVEDVLQAKAEDQEA